METMKIVWTEQKAIMHKLISILMTFNSTIVLFFNPTTHFYFNYLKKMLLFQGEIKDNFNLYHSHMAKRTASVS